MQTLRLEFWWVLGHCGIVDLRSRKYGTKIQEVNKLTDEINIKEVSQTQKINSKKFPGKTYYVNKKMQPTVN